MDDKFVFTNKGMVGEKHVLNTVFGFLCAPSHAQCAMFFRTYLTRRFYFEGFLFDGSLLFLWPPTFDYWVAFDNPVRNCNSSEILPINGLRKTPPLCRDWLGMNIAITA